MNAGVRLCIELYSGFSLATLGKSLGLKVDVLAYRGDGHENMTQQYYPASCCIISILYS